MKRTEMFDRIVHGMTAASSKKAAMPHRVRRSGVLALACSLAGFLAAQAFAAPADTSALLALRLTPNTHIVAARTAIHVVSYDMNHTLMSLLGSRAAPTTLIDARTTTIDVVPDSGHIKEDATSTRRYGGDSPKDKSVVTRHDHYEGSISDSGVRVPAVDRLADAGDGALDELPSKPLHIGQSWSFTRPVSVERSLGQGTMTYTDTLTALADRNGHEIAAIAVSGTGIAQPASDLQAKGFHQASFALHGNAEFDVTAGLPGTQHYDALVEWDARVMFTKIGIKFADTYDASPWTVATPHP
ncbi:MAG TPA: hypothetical protein VJN22_07035 [Candidatus Eremiobacteraceae bacterium]|nr:hypothetical protein [Candidatus Eremiobacteraceae bacterium]